jgi:hypothetical protein
VPAAAEAIKQLQVVVVIGTSGGAVVGGAGEKLGHLLMVSGVAAAAMGPAPAGVLAAAACSSAMRVPAKAKVPAAEVQAAGTSAAGAFENAPRQSAPMWTESF